MIVLALGCLGVGALAAGGAEDVPIDAGDSQAVFVEWFDPRPSDHALLADSLEGGLLAVPFSESSVGHEGGEHDHGAAEHGEEDHGAPHEEGNGFVVGATCGVLASRLAAATRGRSLGRGRRLGRIGRSVRRVPTVSLGPPARRGPARRSRGRRASPPGGFAVGLAACWMVVNVAGVPMPWGGVALALVAVAAASLVSAAVAAARVGSTSPRPLEAGRPPGRRSA